MLATKRYTFKRFETRLYINKSTHYILSKKVATSAVKSLNRTSVCRKVEPDNLLLYQLFQRYFRTN